jgi:mannitol/fructose-specific phosphotransferase system IIA component (Ntr-type)
LTNLITEVVGVIGRSRKGIDFDAVDGQPVKHVILFLVPQGQFQIHLQTLAKISKFLHNPDFLDGR